MLGDREIGGYFQLERFAGKHYHDNLIRLNSGRGCVAYLIDLRGIETIWLPKYLCNCVEELCVNLGVSIRHYDITADFLPDYNFEMGSDDFLYLVDYYGQLSAGDVGKALAFSNGNLIVDEIQDFFRTPWPNADTIYSCRKWFGVSDGAYLSTKDGRKVNSEYPLDESFERMHFVLGRFEKGSNAFYAEADRNEWRFTEEGYRGMSLITSNLLNAVDYDAAIEARNSNWDILANAFSGKNQLVLKKPNGPFRYPLLLEGADASSIRRNLIEKKVYIPILWPDVLESADRQSVAYRYSDEILPIPIDHRYGSDDMRYIIDLISKAANRTN